MRIRPLGNRILVRRIDGHGIETVLPSGVILPATREKSVRNKPDYFKAEVLAIGPEAKREVPELKVEDRILVYTYSGNSESVWTGEQNGRGGLFIRPEDILGVLS